MRVRSPPVRKAFFFSSLWECAKTAKTRARVRCLRYDMQVGPLGMDMGETKNGQAPGAAVEVEEEVVAREASANINVHYQAPSPSAQIRSD